MDIIEDWKRVKATQPDLYQAKWRPGASDEQINQLRKAFGGTVPETFYAFLGVNDGTDHLDTEAQIEAIYENYTAFKGHASILETKKVLDDYEDAGQWDYYGEHQWWNKAWVPFLDQYSGYMYLIDTEGVGAGGRPGQIIEWNSSGKREVVFPSFDTWLEHYMLQLENDLYVDDPGGTGFWLGNTIDGKPSAQISWELKQQLVPDFVSIELPLNCRTCGKPDWERCPHIIEGVKRTSGD